MGMGTDGLTSKYYFKLAIQWGSYPQTQPNDFITLCTGRVSSNPNMNLFISQYTRNTALTVCTNIFLVIYTVFKC